MSSPLYEHPLFQEAQQHLQGGRPLKAGEKFQDLLKQHPDHPELLSNFAVCLMMAGRYAQGLPLLQKALQTNKQNAGLWVNLGRCFYGLKKNQEALGCVTRALQLSPGMPQALTLQQVILAETGGGTSSTAQPLKPTQLAPNLELIYRQAVSAYQKRQFKEARRHIGNLLQLNPKSIPVRTLLGAVDYEEGRYDAAYLVMEQLARETPDDTNVWCNLGKVLSKKGETTRAIASLEKALLIDPNNHEARREYAFALVAGGLSERAIKEYERLIEIDPDDFTTASNMVYLLSWMDHISPREQGDRHRAVGARMTLKAKENPLPNRNPRPLTFPNGEKRRIRLGYVSPDFRLHSIHLFLEQILENHDRAQFELYLYSNTLLEDDATERYKRYGRWRDLRTMNTRQIAECIRQDDIDVLVDLAGHTSRNCLPSLAYKPATVQIGYLGYPTTSGVEALDYFIGDVLTFPSEDDQFEYTERIIRLPRTKFAFRPAASFPAVEPLPALSGNPFTFGCFSNPTKYNQKVLQLWGRLLHAIPEARLLIKARWFRDEEVARTFRNKFIASGGPGDRLLLHDYTESTGDIDLALDPFPFSGATTTCQAFWMGLPVITLTGDTNKSLMTSALLRVVDLPQFIAQTPEQYIEIAQYWAQNPKELAGIRSQLRDRFIASPLRDEVGLTRELEAAYRRVLEAAGVR